MPFILAASGLRDLIGKFLFLSMIIAIIVLPTRLSKGDVRRGPRRAVFTYLIMCGFYYGALRVIIPRV
jgi:uncharacterized membrane protein